MKKVLSILLVILTGCSSASSSSVIPEAVQKEEAPAVIDTAAAQPAGKRSESLYIETDASGKVLSVESEVTLSELSAAPVREETILKEIRNTSGDEEFLQEGNVLYFENKGEEISYKGTAEKALPVQLAVTYLLDGKEIAPQQLAGRSGSLEIRYRLTAQKEGTGVPFAAVVMLPLNDSFRSVEAENASLSEMSGEKFVLGLLLPGLSDQLQLQELSMAEEIEIPEEIVIKAEVEDFELDFSAVIVTNGLFEEAELDVSDLSEGIDDLTAAGKELQEGAGKLQDGVSQFADGLSQYLEGVKTLSDALGEMEKGYSELTENDEGLNELAAGISDGLGKLQEGLEAAELPDAESLGDLCKGLEEMAKGTEDLVSLLEALEAQKEGIDALCDAILSSESGLNEAARAQAETALQEALAETALSEEEKTTLLQKVREGIDLSGDSAGIREAAQQIKDLPLPGTEEAKTALSGLGTQLATLAETLSSGDLADFGEQLSTLQESVRTLAEYAGTLKEGVSAYTGGAEKLSSAHSEIAKGAKTLSDQNGTLSEALKSLKEGTSDFAEGIRKLRKEGFAKLKEDLADPLQRLSRRIDLLAQNDRKYTNYSGLCEGTEGSVTFLFETAEIKK